MITYIPTYKENAAKQKEKDLIDAAETIKSSYSITVLPTVELAYSFMTDAEGALRTSGHYNITRKLLKDARDKYDIYRHALDQVNKNKYGEEGALYFLDLTDSFNEVLKKDIKHFEEAIEKFLIKNCIIIVNVIPTNMHSNKYIPMLATLNPSKAFKINPVSNPSTAPIPR